MQIGIHPGMGPRRIKGLGEAPSGKPGEGGVTVSAVVMSVSRQKRFNQSGHIRAARRRRV
jgi:hypothetical protein